MHLGHRRRLGCLGSDRDATDFAARAAPIAGALDGPLQQLINTGNLVWRRC